jgi:hypothetical protein
MLAARSKVERVLAESEDAPLKGTDLCRCDDSTGALEMLIGLVGAMCGHTSAWACREHAVWCGCSAALKKSRRQDTIGEAPLP